MSIKDIIFKEPVDNRVYGLIDDMKILEEKCSKLWEEVFRLKESSCEISSYAMPILFDRYYKLKEIYDNQKKTYNSLYNEELALEEIDVLDILRALFSSILVTLIDTYTGLIYIIFQISRFNGDILENKLKKDLRKNLEKRSFTGIDINIDNSGRFLRSIIISDFNTPHTEVDIAANNYIHMYINDRIDSNRINDIPDDIKNMIISILKRDLNSDSDDLISLLDEVKKRYTDTNEAKTKAKK